MYICQCWFSVWSGSHHVTNRGCGFLHKTNIAFQNLHEGSGHGPHPFASELLASTSPCFSGAHPIRLFMPLLLFLYLPENLCLLLDESIGTCSFIWQLILRGGKNQILSKFTFKPLKMQLNRKENSSAVESIQLKNSIMVDIIKFNGYKIYYYFFILKGRFVNLILNSQSSKFSHVCIL